MTFTWQWDPAALQRLQRQEGIYVLLTNLKDAERPSASGLALCDDYEPEALGRAGRQRLIVLIAANHQEAHGGDWRQLVRQTVANWRRYPNLNPEELRRIRVPALCIAGEHDPFVGPAEMAELSRHLPGARVEIMAGANHSPHMVGQQPERVNGLIREHLAAAGGSAG